MLRERSVLPEREVNLWLRPLVQGRRSGIGDHTDDLRCSTSIAGKPDLVSEWIAVREVALREGVVDYDNWRRIPLVRCTKAASLQQPNSHHRKVIRCHRTERYGDVI